MCEMGQKMQQIMGYRVEELQKGLWAIDDEKNDSMYLIEGSQKALLIDTCMVDGPLAPLLRQLTDKPVELALTHAHIDHMYHAPEFATVYLHQADIDGELAGVAQQRELLAFKGLLGRARIHGGKNQVRARLVLDESACIGEVVREAVEALVEAAGV